MNKPTKQSQTRKRFESDINFEIISFRCDNQPQYDALAQQLGYDTLKEFLEDECQRALFALTLK